MTVQRTVQVTDHKLRFAANIIGNRTISLGMTSAHIGSYILINNS